MEITSENVLKILQTSKEVHIRDNELGFKYLEIILQNDTKIIFNNVFLDSNSNNVYILTKEDNNIFSVEIKEREDF